MPPRGSRRPRPMRPARAHLDPVHESPRVRLYVQQVGEKWAAMLLADEERLPEPGAVTGLAFFGATPEEAEEAAKVYLGCGEPAN